MDQDQVRHVCCQKVGGAHSCKRCKKFVHVFCGIAEGEEGFGPPSCATIDIVLSKGGPKAIAESYYSAMRAQQQSGGQSNETLARQTKLSWCLPSLKKCNAIIDESV